MKLARKKIPFSKSEESWNTQSFTGIIDFTAQSNYVLEVKSNITSECEFDQGNALTL